MAAIGLGCNFTRFAMRITHIPTGTVVEFRSSTIVSQHKTKQKLLKLLKAKLAHPDHLQNQEVIRTYNLEEGTMVDHRSGYEYPITENLRENAAVIEKAAIEQAFVVEERKKKVIPGWQGEVEEGLY